MSTYDNDLYRSQRDAHYWAFAAIREETFAFWADSKGYHGVAAACHECAQMMRTKAANQVIRARRRAVAQI